MRTITVNITWPDDTWLEGIAELSAPELSAPVRWRGTLKRIGDLPAEIAPKFQNERCDLDSLLTHAETYAASTGGTFKWDSEGAYDTFAE